MENNLNIFGKNLGEIGSLDKNLVLRTKGQVYIRFGRKYIELLDRQGNLNIKVPKFIYKINSEDEMKSNAFYLLDGNVYVYYDGEIILLTGIEGNFISYVINLDLTQDQINIAQTNIGLKFESVEEAKRHVSEGIVFVKDEIFYFNNNLTKELTLNEPLATINSTQFGEYIETPFCIAYTTLGWIYTEIVTKLDLINLKNELSLIISNTGGGANLNTPLKEINEAEPLRTLPDLVEQLIGESTGEVVQIDPVELSLPYAIAYKGNEIWAYEKFITYNIFLELKNYIENCCEEVKEKLEELEDRIESLEDSNRRFTVTWLNKDGSVFTTTTVQNGNSANIPTGIPITKHWSFLGWEYDNSPITEDINIYSTWNYIPPIIYIECNPSNIGNEGGESIVSYWVEWDGDIIINGITVRGDIDKVDCNIGEYYIEDNKIKRKITINENTYSTIGKISFIASFMGEEGEEEGMGLVTTQTMLIQGPAGAIPLPEFDLMKFTTEWTNTTTEDMTGVEGWTLLEDGITWEYDNGSGGTVKGGDLDIRTYTSQTNIIIPYSTKESGLLDKFAVGGTGNRVTGYEVGYGSGGGNFSQISIDSNNGKNIPIVVLKDKTKLYTTDDTEVTEETIRQYNIENNIEETKGLDNYNLYQYLIWSGDCMGPGGEYTVLNFGKIINNVLRVGQKAIFVYMITRWYRYNGTGNFDISYNIYKLNDDEKGLISRGGSFNFEAEDSSVINMDVANNKLENLNYHNSSTWGTTPIATLWYDLNTHEIIFLKGYYTEEDIYGTPSSITDVFEWLPLLEELNDNN